MRSSLVLVFLGALLAGCLEGEPDVAAAPPGPVVTGFVHDDLFRPVPGAEVRLADTGQRTVVDGQGGFHMEVPSGQDLVLTATADGYASASRAVAAGFGEAVFLDFTLHPIPSEEPYTQVLSHKGFLRCAVTVVVGEDPANPHEHAGADCGPLLVDDVEEDSGPWRYVIPEGSQAVVLEAAWDPGSDLSRALVMKVVVNETQEVLGFVEGASPLRMQLSQFHVARLQREGTPGLDVEMLPGAGAGEHEHGAVGVFVNQEFELFATAFFHQPAPPTYSVAG